MTVEVSPHGCWVDVELAGFCRNKEKKKTVFTEGLQMQISLILNWVNFFFVGGKNVHSSTMSTMLSKKYNDLI